MVNLCTSSTQIIWGYRWVCIQAWSKDNGTKHGQHLRLYTLAVCYSQLQRRRGRPRSSWRRSPSRDGEAGARSLHLRSLISHWLLPPEAEISQREMVIRRTHYEIHFTIMSASIHKAEGMHTQISLYICSPICIISHKHTYVDMTRQPTYHGRS